MENVRWCAAARGRRGGQGEGHAGEALHEAYTLRRSGAADDREVPHAVRRAPFDTAGSGIRRAAVEVGLLRAPPKAVPLATVHAAALPGRAPDAHADMACRKSRSRPDGEICVVDRSKTSPSLAAVPEVLVCRLIHAKIPYPSVADEYS